MTHERRHIAYLLVTDKARLKRENPERLEHRGYRSPSKPRPGHGGVGCSTIRCRFQVTKPYELGFHVLLRTDGTQQLEIARV